MTDRSDTPVSSRRLPKQARSAELVSAILEAAIQVLANVGARRFTTTRVAERAGVSVGSIYQYFPNKASILFRLQSDEWRQTTAMLGDILGEEAKAPSERLRLLVHVFVRSECDEAAVRTALSAAAPLYRDAPEAQQTKETGYRAMRAFMEQALPSVDAATRALAGDLITTTLSTVAKQFSESPHAPEEIDAYAGALADMLCGYLADVASRTSRPAE